MSINMEPSGETITIVIPEDISEEDEIAEFLADHVEDFSSALDFSSVPERGVVDDIYVDDVKLEADVVVIQYSYEWSVYYGCDDVDGSDIEEGLLVEGVRKGNSFIFDAHVYPEHRSTNDEF